VGRIISALGARAAAFIMLPLARAPVRLARTAGSKLGTARSRAGAQDPLDTTGLRDAFDRPHYFHRLQGTGLVYSTNSFRSHQYQLSKSVVNRKLERPSFAISPSSTIGRGELATFKGPLGPLGAVGPIYFNDAPWFEKRDRRIRGIEEVVSPMPLVVDVERLSLHAVG
jgi:hypothetical protein